ncbi:acyl-CoA carboxylase epsilon subunit [Streptomyces sp. NPDC005900]|uniref:acyl-CoA carboxylase epsilon subunit n=1 Tax=unclassified Streptomyces TaxID=2593676 RepID=UPI003404ED97
MPAAADIRIEKGEVTDAELAALTVLLLSLTTPRPTTPFTPTPPTTAWRRDNYRPPHSWQT